MVPDYPFLKAVHVGCAAASYVLFFLRGVWDLRGASIMGRRWVRVVPHVIDTLLLASAVAMAVMIHQYPFAAAWLTAKTVALLLYIALGMTALRWGGTPRVRLAAWMGAQATFFYIVAVAVTRDPAPWRNW